MIDELLSSVLSSLDAAAGPGGSSNHGDPSGRWAAALATRNGPRLGDNCSLRCIEIDDLQAAPATTPS